MTNYFLQGILGCGLIGLLLGFLGNFLIVRRLSLYSDVIGHAVLPGVCLGFVIAGFQKKSLYLFLGALFFALLASVLIELFSNRLRTKADAALAIVLSGFYGIGTVMLTWINQHGGSAQAGLNSFLYGQAGALSMDSILWVASIFIFSVLIVVIFFKEFQMCCFDFSFSQLIGFRPQLCLFFLSALVSAAIIVSLEAVGVILVSALMIIPASTASLMSNQLSIRMLLGAIFGGLSAVAGAILSSSIERLPTGPSIVVVATLIFCLVYILHPKTGFLYQVYLRYRLKKKEYLENLLKLLYTQKEKNVEKLSLINLFQKLSGEEKKYFHQVLSTALKKNLVLFDGAFLSLTHQGADYAAQIVRNYRLWELYLLKKLNFEADHVHDDAEEIEHILTPAIVKQLEESLDHPKLDSRGRPIPSFHDLRNLGVPGYKND